MSHPTNSEVISDVQYLVTLESQHREETDFGEDDILVEYEHEPEQEAQNKCSENKLNSRSDIRVQQRGRGMGRGSSRGRERKGEKVGEEAGIKWLSSNSYSTLQKHLLAIIYGLLDLQ